MYVNLNHQQSFSSQFISCKKCIISEKNCYLFLDILQTWFEWFKVGQSHKNHRNSWNWNRSLRNQMALGINYIVDKKMQRFFLPEKNVSFFYARLLMQMLPTFTVHKCPLEILGLKNFIRFTEKHLQLSFLWHDGKFGILCSICSVYPWSISVLLGCEFWKMDIGI